MDIILTESQYMQLLVEKNENKIASVFDKSRDFTKKLISDVKEQYNIDFTFLGTWGSVIGGFARPISKYMEGTYPNLTEQDITLITFGIILTFFSNNKEKLNKVLQLIKEKGIITFFDRAILKAYDLKDAFIGFLDSLNLTMSKVSNMLAYCFLIPLAPLLKDLADLNLSKEQVDLIVTGVSHYTTIVLGSKIVETMVSSILNRFKSSDSNLESDQ
jgi:hypothetical protein